MKIKILKNHLLEKGLVVIMMAEDVHDNYIKGYDFSKMKEEEDLGKTLNKIISL